MENQEQTGQVQLILEEIIIGLYDSSEIFLSIFLNAVLEPILVGQA
jgi:hypothetical protein